MIWITIGYVSGARCEGIPERRFYLGQRPYVAKLFLFTALGHRVPFRPADLARGHPSPPPEVPCEVALVRKTSRQGYFRHWSVCLPQHLFHLFQAPPQQIRVWRNPH